ncbi:DUF4347 domain-containing protein [Chitinophaga oryziterrae]|uniref:DUF4347 domain-containing protein n=1 Tax=Chitinophaga oryziterrae TaxID=1031224 RepID=A0A6N8JDM9_9BACT|nr:RHS repeat-associated core domain-containing protein [Chitinophaga oryziterrae]MVT43330.1 DUF4347 domain-containing protein [Chitinophaga oryziterrae]
MRKVSLFTIIIILISLNSTAQTDIQRDPRVDPLLKLAAGSRAGLTIFGRRDGESTKYVNMAVLDQNSKKLKWFTCYGGVFDSAQLSDHEYRQIASKSLDPFNFYKNYCYQNLFYTENAEMQYRLLGKEALEDTSYNLRAVYTSSPVKSVQSTLQKLMVMEGFLKRGCLQLCLFDCKISGSLIGNDSFMIRKNLAGAMVRKTDTIEYYNIYPFAAAAKIVLSKRSPQKMFVYNREGLVIDSVSLKAGKYASLMAEKEDVFFLYRGWLELQWQQAQEHKQEGIKLLNSKAGVYNQTSFLENREQIQYAVVNLQQLQNSIDDKISSLIVPEQKDVEQLLFDLYRDQESEIIYLGSIGFGYTVSYKRGNKRYELTDHRGNVLATVSDKKVGVSANGNTIDHYEADIVSAQDYYPFGMQMPGRGFNSSKYRYGYNDKENDNEVKGDGNQQDYGMRVSDPRLGRFLSVDPITAKYPELTPYQFASNRPIDGIDMDGLEFVKKPNPEATALFVTNMGLTEWAGMNNAAVANRNIDVLNVSTIKDMNHYLKGYDKKYSNIIFAGHGGVFGAAQVIGTTKYQEKDLITNSSSFEALSKNIAKDGKVILLGCFCAAPQNNGDNFMRIFSNLVDHNVIADQGESWLGPNTFKWDPLGKPPLPRPGSSHPFFYDWGVQNAGKWSEAKPNGVINPNIGNVRLDDKGAPHTEPYIPPLKPADSPLPTWQSIVQ